MTRVHSKADYNELEDEKKRMLKACILLTSIFLLANPTLPQHQHHSRHLKPFFLISGSKIQYVQRPSYFHIQENLDFEQFELACFLSTISTLLLLELQRLLPQSAMHVRGSLVLPCTIIYPPISVDEISNRLCDIRSGPVSLHEAGLEQVQEKGSAEASSSNFDDTQDQNTATSILSRQESMKRKVPDDGFDGDNVRISFLLLLCCSGI